LYGYEKIWLNYYVVSVRLLIGYAFLPSGLIKLLGRPFTSLPDSNPVGHFFNAMYNTGIYWNFLGLMQVLAGILLMTQRFATVGALLYLGIITNIVLITYGIGFGNTTIIAVLMLLATLSLIVWDFQKIKLLFLQNKDVQFQELQNDLISKTWYKFGLIVCLFLTIVSAMPFLVAAKYRNAMTLIFIPALLVAVSYAVVLVRDYKMFKRNGSI
jgi:hypothetical protein